ncbi:T9SS type A sorting domain-containing protein [Parasediminibacterium sp. JCM 36343]|uniref:T9SS type A sorting domain-containing protein n=1 Tax=Parasediminibacterium sp. JCM 36343 TaxID=3374279 RepID=UPI00397B9AA1
MKKVATFLLFFIITGLLYANGQPILTAAGVNPVTGDKYTQQWVLSSSIAKDALTSGENQTWDFSNMIDSVAFNTFLYIAPSSDTPGIDSFPDATIASYDSAARQYNYFNNNDTVYNVLGYYNDSTATSTRYTPAIAHLSYPMSYQKVFVSSTYYIDPTYNVPVVIIDTLTADAYGTMTLPGATYTDVLRVKAQVHFSTNIMGTNYEIGTQKIYAYYVNGIHEPIATFQTTDDINWQATYNKIGTIVPLSIHGLSVGLQKNLPLVKWQAENTANTSKFIVQRSGNQQYFENIGFVEADKSRSAYQFSDPTPVNGTTYYRIEQQDKNGEAFYSNIVSLQPASKVYSYNVYPNPAHGNIHLSIPEDIASDVKIYNMEGKMVFENQAFKASESIATGNWAAGHYLLVVKTGNGIKMNKFEKH